VAPRFFIVEISSLTNISLFRFLFVRDFFIYSGGLMVFILKAGISEEAIQNFRKERRVSWYGEQLGITPKYLSETVRNVSKRTPNQWIDKYITLELRVQLKNTTKSVKEIAKELNFPNQSFLGKFFKEQVGLSPSQYRKR